MLEQPAARELRWSPVPKAQLNWFELYRVGEIGSRKVLEAFPTEPTFTLPASALTPGLYNWSASPETTRAARVRSTVLTRAGRFRITADGEMIPVRS